MRTLIDAIRTGLPAGLVERKKLATTLTRRILDSGFPSASVRGCWG